jgi:hypothetical protein
MHANGNIEGVTLWFSAGLARRPRGRDAPLLVTGTFWAGINEDSSSNTFII